MSADTYITDLLEKLKANKSIEIKYTIRKGEWMKKSKEPLLIDACEECFRVPKPKGELFCKPCYELHYKPIEDDLIAIGKLKALTND